MSYLTIRYRKKPERIKQLLSLFKEKRYMFGHSFKDIRDYEKYINGEFQSNTLTCYEEGKSIEAFYQEEAKFRKDVIITKIVLVDLFGNIKKVLMETKNA